MKLIIASNNAHKLTEIRAILGDSFESIRSMAEAGIVHEAVEDGSTFAENAEKKAREIMELTGKCALADDSGLCVDALGGGPGIYSARYCGVHGDDAANRVKLLQELAEVPDEMRGAHFACAMALVRPDGSVLRTEGRMYGVIAHEEVGEYGFGYDSLFYLPERGCTNAQLLPEEKNAISHRAKALHAMLALLQQEAEAQV